MKLDAALLLQPCAPAFPSTACRSCIMLFNIIAFESLPSKDEVPTLLLSVGSNVDHEAVVACQVLPDAVHCCKHGSGHGVATAKNAVLRAPISTLLDVDHLLAWGKSVGAVIHAVRYRPLWHGIGLGRTYAACHHAGMTLRLCSGV